MFVYVIVRLTCHHPPPILSSYPSIILPLPLFKRCSECLRLCLLSTFRFYSYSCWSSFVPIFSLLSTTFSSRDNISIVFKIGSTVLQRTIYDPILRAILMPKYVYFHVLNFKIFHFWHKIVKLTYCIIFWSLQKIEFLK